MISFIIPTLNEEKVIADTLKNISGYSGSKEIIVSDGNSSDATIAISKQYADRVIIHDGIQRQTIGGGRNAGAAVAQGDFLVFIDADVTIPNIDTFLNKAEHYFKQNPSLIGITVQYKVLPELATVMDRIMFKIVGLSFFIVNNITHIGGAGGEFQMIRPESFRTIGGFNESLALSEDADLFQRLAKIGRTKYYGNLFIYHTGRRAHKIGWAPLLYQWIFGWISLVFFKKSFVDEWKQIR